MEQKPWRSAGASGERIFEKRQVRVVSQNSVSLPTEIIEKKGAPGFFVWCAAIYRCAFVMFWRREQQRADELADLWPKKASGRESQN
jgi:hypothetical protein